VLHIKDPGATPGLSFFWRGGCRVWSPGSEGFLVHYSDFFTETIS